MQSKLLMRPLVNEEETQKETILPPPSKLLPYPTLPLKKCKNKSIQSIFIKAFTLLTKSSLHYALYVSITVLDCFRRVQQSDAPARPSTECGQIASFATVCANRAAMHLSSRLLQSWSGYRISKRRSQYAISKHFFDQRCFKYFLEK